MMKADEDLMRSMMAQNENLVRSMMARSQSKIAQNQLLTEQMFAQLEKTWNSKIQLVSRGRLIFYDENW